VLLEYGAGMSLRLAAYAVCLEDGRVLLARYVSPAGGSWWTLPGGGVEHGEDPFDAVIREVAEETGCAAVVTRLLGVDSRVIPAANGLTMARTAPPTGHVPPVPVGGLAQH
jgi:8-oxo-dGTP diphosphatase